MRILYVCLDWGIPIKGFKGASVHVREFVNALDRLGHQVVLIAANRGEGNPDPNAALIELAPERSAKTRAEEAARLGIEDHESSKGLRRELDKLAYDRSLPARAVAALRASDFSPDLVYERFSLFHKGGAAIAAALDVPHFLEVNAPLIEEHERHRGLSLRAVAEAARSECFQSASHIVTVSEALKAYVEAAGISPYRVTCLPNGVDVDRFNPSADAQLIRDRHALGGRPVIGFVSSLKPWHGLGFLFDALALIGRWRKDHLLMVVGNGPGFDYSTERAEEEDIKGRVILTGKVPHAEIPSYLAAMDLTVAPYQAEEGFYVSPLKVLESLAAGRPVVAPRLGQLNDLIEDGATGLLYQPGDLDAFAGSVQALLSDPGRRETMGRKARRFATANLSWDSVARRSAGIMSEALQRV